MCTYGGGIPGMCGQSEWAQHFTMHADFRFCRQKDEKTHRGRVGKWSTYMYLKTVHVVCTNSDVHVYTLPKSTHILTKNLVENAVNNQQLATILTFSTSNRSARSDFSKECPMFGEKSYNKQIHCRVSTDCRVWACIKSQRFTHTQKRLWQDLCNSFLNRKVQIWTQISIYRCAFLVRSIVNCKRLWISLLTSFTNT